MIKRLKIWILLVLLILAGFGSYSQALEIEMAEEQFNDLQFVSASENYRKAIRKIKEVTTEKLYCTYKLAECYRMMNDPDQAEPFYKELVENNYGDTVPVVFLRYATVLKTRGDASGARKYFSLYLKSDPGNEEALTGLKSCDWLLENEKRKAQVVVEELKSINSIDDEFGPAYLDASQNQLVFTSNRVTADARNIDQWTGARFSDLYSSTLNGKNWSDPSLIEYFSLVNSDVHEGTPSLNGDFTSMYYTRCGKVAETQSFCEIWKTTRNGNEWTKPVPVLTDTAANIGHPSISKDELTLYFSSNKAGGQGGKDIWVVSRKSKDVAFGTPLPLGKEINTAGDELFPFLFNDTTLLFASNGYEGYGGLDLYISFFRNNSWSKPENLLTPINSSYDDFGIIIKKPFEEGCFCSNRSGGTGGDDIYGFYRKIFLFTLSGHVRDNMTLLSMVRAEVLLISEKGDTAQTLTDKQGYYSFDNSKVLEDVNYEVVFRKDGYFSKKEVFSTNLFDENHDFTFDVRLEPIPEKPIVLPDILYALDKWDLAPQYQDSLMQLVRLLRDNEKLVIELRSHTDSRGSSAYNDVLSQKRAQSVVDFIVSQGIDPGRLVAKGYGERICRVIDKNITRENYTFKAGTELNDAFISSLPNKDIQEAAFQLNRRTEFAVIAKDYKPGEKPADARQQSIQVVSDSSMMTLDYDLTPEGKMKVSVYINDYSAEALLIQDAPGSSIDERIVLDLLQKGGIDRTDFQGSFEEIMINDHIVPNTLLNLEKTRLGELVITNAAVKVMSGNGPYLQIGKDMLDKFGPFIVDEQNRQLIFKQGE